MENSTIMCRLGDFICEVNERNSNRFISLSQGICNLKYFQNPRQVSATPELDKIVRTGQFAYNRATTRNGDKISIALREGPDCTVSLAYCVFYITDENVIDPSWLWLWFKRPDFDRYAIFKSHGRAHEFFEFETMCNVKLSVPPIEEQRAIVARHRAIEHKIDVNHRLIAALEETARTIYRHTFIDNIDPENLPQGWRIGTIGDFGTIITGKTPSSAFPKDFGDDMDFITPGEFKNDDIFYSTPIRKLSKIGQKKLRSKLIPKYGLSVTCIGSDMGKVRICKNECISNLQINSIITNSKYDMTYLFFTLRQMKNELKQIAVGSSTMPMLSKFEFEIINIIQPSKTTLEKFYKFVFPILDYCFSLEKENEVLHTISSILLNKLYK